MLVELAPRHPVDHEAQRRVGVGRPVRLGRLGNVCALEPLLVGLAVAELDEGALLARRRVREVRVEERDVTEGGDTGRILDRGAELLGSLGDAVKSRHEPAGRERSAATARREGDLGVQAHDRDALALDRRRVEREEVHVVLEQDGRVGGGRAQEGAQLGRVDLVLAGVKRDARVDGVVDELEDVARTVVNVLERELASAQCPVHGLAAHDGRAGHLNVEAGLDGLVDRDDTGPVGADQAVPAPLAAEDAVEELLVLRAVRAVEAVVGRHEGLGRGVLDGEAERLEVDLAEGALRYDAWKHPVVSATSVRARGRSEDALSDEKRSNSWSLATKCLMHAATPLLCTPLTYSAATACVRYSSAFLKDLGAREGDARRPDKSGSSLYDSKPRPPSGLRWMLMVGPRRT